jgi:hypothetical protein
MPLKDIYGGLDHNFKEKKAGIMDLWPIRHKQNKT